MNRIYFLFLQFLVLVLLLGCAGKQNDKYVSSEFAFRDPKQGISIRHPKDLKDEGVESVVIFDCFFPTELFVEAYGVNGVFPSVARRQSDGKIFKGYAYLLKIDEHTGKWLLRNIFIASEEDLKNAKIILLNKDDGFAYTLDGKEAIKKVEKNIIAYDPEKFEKDQEYQSMIFAEFGMDFAQLLQARRESFYNAIGIMPSENYRIGFEVKTSSLEWEGFIAALKKDFPSVHVISGKNYLSFLPEGDFQSEYVTIPGFSTPMRYIKDGSTTLLSFPVMPDMGTMVAANIVGDVLHASIDDSWSGYFARATVLRYELSSTFREVCAEYEKVISSLAKKNIELERENNRLKQYTEHLKGISYQGE